jgi:hypothetical protein
MHITKVPYNTDIEAVLDWDIGDIIDNFFSKDIQAIEDFLKIDIESTPCLFLRIKQRIIKLRKHLGNDDDWINFKKDIENHLNYICHHLSIRWLVSIAETYIEYGTDLEKSNAMLLSFLVNWEKIWHTINYHHNQSASPYIGMYMPVTANFGDKEFTQTLNVICDTRNIFFNHLRQCFEKTPIIHSLFNKTLFSFMKWEDFSLNKLDQLHKMDVKSEILNLLIKS